MNTAIIIFGASGDLTGRKLLPALYNNFKKHRLPDLVQVVGISRTPMTDDGFRQKMAAAVRSASGDSFDENAWRMFVELLHFQSGDLNNRDVYTSLLKQIGPAGPQTNCLFYLATAPQLYPAAIGHLSGAGMLAEKSGTGFRRIIVEKPFGRDLQSARALNELLHGVVNERQVFRIDHYLGKETVQNVLMLRFGNAIFEPLWNRNHIDHIQITVAETGGVEHRAGYYDTAGVLRDMFQNHLLQLLTLVAMEPPAIVEAEALRDEKVKVLNALREIAPEHSRRETVRGQYQGYTSEAGVDPTSATETFAAIQVYIDNWRWQGVPFYIRSGKMLKEKTSEILIQFRRPPTQIFDLQAGATELFTNHLSIVIQPNEGMHLQFIAKVPDEGMRTRRVDMNFLYRDSFDGRTLPEAYDRLLLDALLGDSSLFTRSDEIELAWRFIDGVMAGWNNGQGPPLLPYAPGTWGPAAADQLLGRGGRWWIHDAGFVQGGPVPPLTS